MSTQRFYTHAIVSYARLEELMPLFNQANHYCYILHDKDKTDVHYHIIATFPIQKSINAVRKMPASVSNTFSQPLDDVNKLLDYFTHKDEEGKAEYDASGIVYDDLSYWQKRMSSGDVDVPSNDMFVDDLLASTVTIEFMSRKYGRDFMKNYKTYMSLRKVINTERTLGRKGDDYNNVIFED